MKLYCLSSDAAKPCFVLSFKELLIMLDCGLSAHSVLNFLPLPPVPSTRLASLPNYTPPHINDPLLEGELKECCGRVFVDSIPEFCPPLDKVVDFSQLDVILISNYTCMMALPFITEDTGFKGQVYATEPTLQIGRFYLEELAAWVGAGAGGGRARRWKELLHVLPAPLSQAARPRAWRRLFAPAAVARALARVRVVGYDERVDVYGALDATPVSSGFCLGSANWVLRSAHEKVAYVSGSSTLTTHPRPINQAALRGADLLVLAALTQTPAHNPDHMLGDLCVHATLTLRAGGCVLCPVYPSGVLYDLLECLSQHLDGAGLAHVPLYVVSPVADSSLAYSNILAEWVSVTKQARVYLPEEPFPHAALARAGRLKHARNLHDDSFSADFRQPCVVFCGHPSLRFGAAVHLVELWANNPAHAIIFTEPDFPHTEALAPFQPLSMKAFHCPIDTSLNYSQASKLVRELRPRELALPEQYAAGGGAGGGGGGGAGRAHVAADVATVVVRRGAARAVGGRRRAARGLLCGRLAARAAPTDLRPGLRAAPLAARLQLRDSRLLLLPPPAPPGAPAPAPADAPAPAPAPAPALHWGALDVEALVRALAREGVAEARVERGAADEGCIVHLPRHDTLVHVEPHATHVFCEGRAHVRQALRRALAACLPHI
ncbi:integrator complex subunit 9 [Achroia grisella]|uniref:integrator complex subunit 9 n=1 Tax=Achroia grisella TaxID=688607 RepID=UPI0027D290FB|nr:integrator complex subunit 9 [Achroia grisella]